MKRAWDPVTLTVNFWHGNPPEGGDTLRTKTGRQYLILQVVKREDKSVSALKCMVLPMDEPASGTVHEWQWSPRIRAPRGRTW